MGYLKNWQRKRQHSATNPRIMDARDYLSSPNPPSIWPFPEGPYLDHEQYAYAISSYIFAAICLDNQQALESFNDCLSHCEEHFARPLLVKTKEHIENDYELNTGRVIVSCFADIDPAQTPACVVANHGPFTWGPSTDKAVESAVVLEQVAKMAMGTLILNPEQNEISRVLLDKHYLRKHGENAYYGQK